MMPPSRHTRALALLAVALVLLAACQAQMPSPPGLEPLEQPSSLQAAEPRVSGTIPTDRSRQRAFEERGVASVPTVAPPPAVPTPAGGGATVGTLATPRSSKAR